MFEPDFRTDGAQRFRCALSDSDLENVLTALNGLPSDTAGLRLADVRCLGDLLSAQGAVGRIADGLIGPGVFPVRAVLFDKTATTNWSLGWHQDRTIVVCKRIETPGYGPWSTKSGLQHVSPPFHLLESMATLRLHLDPVDLDNAPLRIAPGSHALGRLAETAVRAVVSRLGDFACLADRGDVWAYATPILHASEAAVSPRRRRVLQIDYAARPLDGELEWLGVC